MAALQLGHQLELLQGGQDFFPALIEAIDSSVQEVRIETYIFNTRHSSALVAEALERAAARGVAVYLVMDGVGTPTLEPQWCRRFERAGVAWHIFAPMGRLGLLIPSRWRRLHRKLCVVDGRLAFCGGINLLDDFFDPNHGALSLPRLDFAVRVSGPLVREAHAEQAQFWWRLQAVRTAQRAQRKPHLGRGCRPCRSPQHQPGRSAPGPPWCCVTTCCTARALNEPTAVPLVRQTKTSSLPMLIVCPDASCAKA
ncbi:MAG: phospholipase D-like domain-containing protein [Burkholderiales bacterium]|nr:phospholipase D-like domain-containing protein [Burkholderiales bacterium]